MKAVSISFEKLPQSTLGDYYRFGFEETRMIRTIADLTESLQQKTQAKGLSGSLKVNLGDEGVIFIDGSAVSNTDGKADCTITTTLEMFSDLYAGKIDAVQAHYKHRLQIDGSQLLATQLTALMDNAEGPSKRIGRFSRDADVQDIATALRSTGAVVIENCVTDELADRVAAELRPHFDESGTAYQADFEGYKTLRLGEILARSRSSSELVGEALLLSVIDEILLPHCINYRIGSCTGIEIFPGETAQELHRDDGIYPIHIQGVEWQVSAMWALSDFTKKNGATHLLPGSHDGPPRAAAAKSDYTAQAEMTKGSVLLYLGSLLHGGGANNSDQPRMGLVNTYAVGWLRQEENHYLAIPKEIADSYPLRIRELMGYQTHGLLGWYPDAETDM
ncbi:MAG: phytanoyl-CoA dioxygenase family protein [Gammaproteobacteria bacterium]|nr:phytanoyl-CoA dioxygenase family protein [Gammaproteobacteria bacterium]